MDHTRKSTLAGSAVIVATVAVAVFFGPYIRTPTGGRQLDQNKSGSVQMVERIADLCGARVETVVPSFRTWIPKSVLSGITKVSVATDGVSESIDFSNENCRSTTTLKKIGKAAVCVSECIAKACLVAVKPQGPHHFGTSKVAFLDGSGAAVHSETFVMSRLDVKIPEVSVMVDENAVIARTEADDAHLSGVAHFPPLENAPEVLKFKAGTARVDIPPGSQSYAIFVQRDFGAAESLDLRVGSLTSNCPD